MNITQTFYDHLATQYDKLFHNWTATTKEQAALLQGLFAENGYDFGAKILDCACGIGTQAIGLAGLGYDVTASDISEAELREAEKRAEENGVSLRFAYADFRNLGETFSERFHIVICMDNALPHMLTETDLEAAVSSMVERLTEGGMLIASIRDYDTLLRDKPPYSPPYIHKTEKGQRVSFQTWDWHDRHYRFVQYIIDDEDSLQISKFPCEYRGILRAELTELLLANGCKEVAWKLPEDTGFYQPIVIAKK